MATVMLRTMPATHFMRHYTLFGAMVDYLGGRDSRALSNNARIERRGEDVALRLYSTDVITVAIGDIVTLRAGGHQTDTTRRYINAMLVGAAYLNDCKGGHGARLYQENFVWYVTAKSGVGVIFKDGMQIDLTAGDVL